MSNASLSNSDHVRQNREVWDGWSERYAEYGRTAWSSGEIKWGIWQIPETELRALPEVRGKDRRSPPRQVISIAQPHQPYNSWMRSIWQSVKTGQFLSSLAQNASYLLVASQADERIERLFVQVIVPPAAINQTPAL